MAAHAIAIASPSSAAKTALVTESRTTLQTVLLGCGIAAPLLYVAKQRSLP
jgi:hypothetical protein